MTGATGTVSLPDAEYLVLASRVDPSRDGGFAVAVPWRVRQLQAAGARHPLLLTTDPADPATHARWCAQLVERGSLADASAWCNLFDEVAVDPSWLFAAGRPGRPDPALEYRQITDASARPLVSLPVVDDPAWHLSTAPVVIHAPDGIRVLPGFGGLYRAWLDHIVARLRARAGDPGRRVVVVCEARQLGELLVDWGDENVRLVHTVHNSHLPAPYDDPRATPAPPWARWLAVIHRFDAVLWPTRGQRDDVAACYGADDAFHIVPNPIELGDEPGASPRAAAAVVAVGRLAEQKRFDRAIDAFARVHAVVPDATVDIYGDGPLRGRLQGLIDARGLQGVVRLRGSVSPAERDAALDAATLSVVSAAFEGQGLSIAEALARGVPVVAFDAKYGPAEVIGDAGVLVPAGDVEALAEAMVALLGDPARRAELSANARRAAGRFAPEAIRPALVSAIAQALARPSRRV